MNHQRNPQAEQMAHESMVRNLAAQCEAVWPQERALIAAYGLGPGARVLDVGCGTGELLVRLAEAWPELRIWGVDVLEGHLARARARCERFGDRVTVGPGDGYGLDFDAGTFDLTLCRHLLQALPGPERVVEELVRVTRPGGRVHLVAEDYGMIHFHPCAVDTDAFWARGPVAFARRTGSDLLIGRKTPTVLHRLGLERIRVDYVVVDTCRVSRELFASIWTAWRDGYADAIARETDLTREQVRAAFDGMIGTIRDPEGYAVWQLPVVSGAVPPAPGSDRSRSEDETP